MFVKMSAVGDGQLKWDPLIIRMFGSCVTDFSSQYGAEARMSYAAYNLAGKCSIYPSYGDFTQACVFRTYGPWWKIVPSAFKPYTKMPSPSSLNAEDFVEVKFEESVYPVAVQIYETYNPGAIVRILGCDADAGTNVDNGREKKWVILWSKPVTKTAPRVRIFSPPIKRIDTKINMLRLEVNHQFMDYYAELDAVMLCGVPEKPSSCQEFSDLYLHVINHMPSDHTFYTPEQLCPKVNEKEEKICVCGEPVQLMENMASLELSAGTPTDGADHVHPFQILPGEVIMIVLGFLDILSLARVAQTCKLLQKHVYDCMLYTELDLQPVWYLVTDIMVGSMLERCARTQRLNLSWCGKNRSIHHKTIERLMDSCGETLTCLQLSSCSFIDEQALDIIARNCQKLKELDLSSCTEVNQTSTLPLSQMTKLERLNLYRTKIDTASAIQILRSMPELQHLNLGSCCMIRNMSEVVASLGQSCPNLKSVDLWRAQNLKDGVFQEFVQSCPLLEELDLGWTTDLNSRNNSFICIAECCKNLKKLYLTAVRSVCDADLLSLAKHNKHLQQLDILGTREVSAVVAEQLLASCKDMVMFDISFCAGISDEDVGNWRRKYPHCDIKKSFQYSG